MESGSSQVSADSSLDYTFAFNEAKFSDRTLQIVIVPESTGSKPDPIDRVSDKAPTRRRKHRRRCRDQDSNVHEVIQSNENQSSKDNLATQVKTIHISTPILSAKSPFFYKLFSNGMSESNEQHVTLQIQESEEPAFMDMLKFMYTNTLSSDTPSALLDILMAADKYEVALCMKYCVQLLRKSPMTCESALLYLDLPSTITMADAVQLLIDAAKEFLVARFKDISKFQKQMLNLPLVGIEAILSSNDLQVNSEDEIYDFVMKWARRHYSMKGEQREMLITRLLHLIRFPFMSRGKLEEVLTCTDINLEHRSKLVFDAISQETQHRRLPPVKEKERAYNIRPVKVTQFHYPQEKWEVYLDLTREECARLSPNDSICSQPFYLGGQAFYLNGMRYKNRRRKRGHPVNSSFGLFLNTRENGPLHIELAFSSRKKHKVEFVELDTGDYNFDKADAYGIPNLFDVRWDEFIAENSPYSINGVLHLKAALTILHS